MALRDAIKLNQVPMEKFIITKGLTKNPKEYTDAKNMPHVKVALDLLAKGKSCKSGDFIGYVICKNAGGNDAQLAARAYDPAHVMSMGGGLELDLKWYLTNQILPPVARLIGPIEETDAGKVAYALGLDPKAFHNFGSKDEKAVGDGDDDDTLMLQGGSADDEEKFKNAVAIQVACPHCEAIYQFPGVFHKLDGSSTVAIKPADAAAIKEEMKEGDSDVAMTSAASASAMSDVKKEGVQGIGSGSLQPLLSGLKCPNFLTTGCTGLLSTADDAPRVLTQLSNRINCEIRRQTQKYYSGFYKCNDSSCGRRSRDLSVKGNQCQAQGCKGRMEREVRTTMNVMVCCPPPDKLPSVLLTPWPRLLSAVICVFSSPHLSCIFSFSISARCSMWSAPSKECSRRIRGVSGTKHAARDKARERRDCAAMLSLFASVVALLCREI